MNTIFSKFIKTRLGGALKLFGVLVMILWITGFSVQAAEYDPAVFWDVYAVGKPAVIQLEGGGYMMWYDGSGPDGLTRVGLARSDDGITWEKETDPVLVGDPGEWDSSGEHAPFVLKEDSTYKMWYEGQDGAVRQLGYATSGDGIDWEKYTDNPVITAGPEEYDQFVAGHGSVLYDEDDGTYKLWYHVVNNQNWDNVTIAYATSSDGVSWNKMGPLIFDLQGLEEGWEEAFWGPSVLKVGGEYRMWYSAYGSGYGVSIGYAVSSDGQNWFTNDTPIISYPDFSLGDPYVIYDQDNGLYKMWVGNYNDGRIYYTESPNGIDEWSDLVPVLFPSWLPEIRAWLGRPRVEGYQWPLGALVTLEIDEETFDPQEVQGDENGTFVRFDLGEWELEPGQQITMSAGEMVKTHEILPVSITVVDPDFDTVEGTASGNGMIILCIYQGGCEPPFELEPAQDWSWWKEGFDLQPGFGMDATEFDWDGDGTSFEYWIPNPWLGAHPVVNAVEGWEWPLGVTVTLYIDDPSTDKNPDFTSEGTIGSLPWDPKPYVRIDFDKEYDLKVKDVVTLTDGVNTQEHTVLNLAVTEVDAGDDIVAGTAEEGRFVQVWPHGEDWAFMEVTAEGEYWIADFKTVGFDLVPGVGGRSQILDGFGNATVVDWQVPNPRFTVFPEWEYVEVYEFPEGAEVVATLNENEDCTATGVALYPEWDLWNTFVGMNFPEGCDVSAYDTITVEGGGLTLSHEVRNLAVTWVDVDYDTVSGTADEGVEVRVWAHANGELVTVTANGDGNWQADLSEVFNLVPGEGGRSEIVDENSNATAVDWYIPIRRIYANVTNDSLRFESTIPGREVHFWIYDGIGEDLLWDGVQVADEGGNAYLSIWDHRVDLEEGIYVEASDGIIQKELLIGKLSLDGFDEDEDALYGTASPGSTVWAVATEDHCGMETTTLANGNWIADYTGQEPFCDVTEGMWLYAQIVDEEGDTTEAVLDFIEGYHDYDAGYVPSWACNVGGWAVDSDDRERDVAIQVIVGDQTIPTTAGNPRDDLQGICGQDGSCGFEVNLWDVVPHYQELLVTVQAYDQETMQWIDLNDTPKTLNCRTYDLYAYNPKTGETRQITDLRDTDEYNPSWSPLGNLVAHHVVGPDHYGIWVTNIKTGISTPLRGAQKGNDPAWSPNGLWIAFDRRWEGDNNIYLVPFTGGKPRLIQRNAISPEWSPSGSRLVFQDSVDGKVKTSGLLSSNTIEVADYGENPSWSPDGRWIAYSGENADIWVVRVNWWGKPMADPVQLTTDGTIEGHPTWSADSRAIIFHAGMPDGDFDLWTVPVGGGEATWLTGYPRFGDYDPDTTKAMPWVAYAGVSPDGQAPREWVAAFTYDLAPGSLSDGTYPYHFEFEWSEGEFSGQGGEFVISSEADKKDGYVLLRGFRELCLAEDGISCEDIEEIHPDQPLRFLVGWLPEIGAVSYQEARTYYDSLSGWVFWGDGNSAELQRREIRHFSGDEWPRYVCTYTQREYVP